VAVAVEVGHLAEVVLERVERALYLSMFQNLPGAVAEIAAEWVSEDAAFYAALGQSVPDTPLPPPVLYFEGHHPSALDRDPLSEYPNVTVMAYNGAHSDSNPADQLEPVRYIAYVELFCVDQDENRINRKAKRYSQALGRAITRFDPSLGGLCEPLDQVPEVAISNASARRYSQYTDEVWFAQGCRLDYQFRVREPW
jgi:hypothetical protein